MDKNIDVIEYNTFDILNKFVRIPIKEIEKDIYDNYFYGSDILMYNIKKSSKFNGFRRNGYVVYHFFRMRFDRKILIRSQIRLRKKYIRSLNKMIKDKFYKGIEDIIINTRDSLKNEIVKLKLMKIHVKCNIVLYKY